MELRSIFRRWARGSLVAGLGVGLAVPVGAAEPGDVTRPLGGGAVINWTTLRLEVRKEAAESGTVASLAPLEQAALDQGRAEAAGRVGSVPLTKDLLARGVPGFDATRATQGWQAIETVYAPRGVSVLGAVDLRAALAGWVVSESVVPALKPPETVSGVVVDARGTKAEPVYAPRIVDPAGEVLHDGRLWRAVAYDRPPATWVTAVTSSAAAAAGPRPLFLLAESASEGVIVLDAASATRYRADVAATWAHGSGAWVIIVDR